MRTLETLIIWFLGVLLLTAALICVHAMFASPAVDTSRVIQGAWSTSQFWIVSVPLMRHPWLQVGRNRLFHAAAPRIALARKSLYAAGTIGTAFNAGIFVIWLWRKHV